jgi:hypothetical protein
VVNANTGGLGGMSAISTGTFIDTRNNTGTTGGPVAGNSSRSFQITGASTPTGNVIPADARAVMGNISILPASGTFGGFDYAFVYPTGSPGNNIAVTGAPGGSISAGFFFSPLNGSGQLTVAPSSNQHILISISGYA